MDHGSSIW